MVGQGPGKVSVMELTKEEGDSTHSRNTSFCIMTLFGLNKAFHRFNYWLSSMTYFETKTMIIQKHMTDATFLSATNI